MYLVTQNEVCDYDLDLLSQLLNVLDEQLDKFENRCQSSEDADAFGLYDWAEHIAGIGFAACQTYIAATYPVTRMAKVDALRIGPLHGSSGRPVAAILNAAANFWKHHPEWPLEKSQTRQDAVRAAFEDLGYAADGEYPLSGILAQVTGGQARFSSILPLLTQWRDQLIGRAAQPTD
jgi:hypothetical protein